MIWVDHAALAPHTCMLTFNHEGPFIDLGVDLMGVDPHPYLSPTAAREIGRFVEMVEGDEHERVLGEVKALEAKITGLEERLAESERFAESVEYTLKGVEKIRNKPGPKKS